MLYFRNTDYTSYTAKLFKLHKVYIKSPQIADFTPFFALLCGIFSKFAKISFSRFPMNIYIKVKPYVHQWCENSFGNPCEFPAKGRANSEIRCHLQPLPFGKTPHLQQADEMAVRIPESGSKKTSTYNYVTKEGIDCIRSVIDSTFDADLKGYVFERYRNGVNLKIAVHAWCRNHGINVEHEDTLKQRCNRMIMSLKKKGIQIKKNDGITDHL